MSRESEARRLYEERVVDDSLTRLSTVVDRKSIPLSDEELRTLAKRARQSFGNTGRAKERLDRYKAHLSQIYGTEAVSTLASKLETINNEIGYEEK